MKKHLPAKILLAAALLICSITSYAQKPAALPQKAAPAQKAAPLKLTLEDPRSWSMVIVPDVQTYIKQIENHGILDMMLAWIVRRREEMNIQQVLFTGDLVYFNDTGRVVKFDNYLKSGRCTDLVSDEQWKAFSRLMERLDGELPYILCTGNHDYGIRSAESRKTHFNTYFPTDRNPLTRRQLFECGTNTFGARTLENSAYEFTAPHPDNRKFLVITLQFAPTDGDLKWAKKNCRSALFCQSYRHRPHPFLHVCQRQAHPERKLCPFPAGRQCRRTDLPETCETSQKYQACSLRSCMQTE